MFVERTLKLWFVVCSTHIRENLIYCGPNANYTLFAQYDQGTLMYIGLIKKGVCFIRHKTYTTDERMEIMRVSRQCVAA